MAFGFRGVGIGPMQPGGARFPGAPGGGGGFGGIARPGGGGGVDPRTGPMPTPRVRSFKKGGKVKGKKGKAVLIKAHAGERVLNAKQEKAWEKRKRKKSDSNAYVAGRRA